MESLNNWQWSEHALERWRERGGSDFVKNRVARTAKLAGRKTLKKIRKQCPAHSLVSLHKPYTGFHYVVSERWIFVKSGNVVVTCWPQGEKQL